MKFFKVLVAINVLLSSQFGQCAAAGTTHEDALQVICKDGECWFPRSTLRASFTQFSDQATLNLAGAPEAWQQEYTVKDIERMKQFLCVNTSDELWKFYRLWMEGKQAAEQINMLLDFESVLALFGYRNKKKFHCFAEAVMSRITAGYTL